jgi:hypothetical protein
LILVDTSIWVDHLRSRDVGLAGQLEAGRVLAHPFVIGELALGILENRDVVLAALADLPAAVAATDAEVLELIDREALPGRGIGYVDAHLLAAARLSHARLWTRDERLHAAAAALGIAGS